MSQVDAGKNKLIQGGRVVCVCGGRGGGAVRGAGVEGECGKWGRSLIVALNVDTPT